MATDGFPSHPAAVSAEWLNGILGDCESLVEQVTWGPIGTGQVGDSVRFFLTHADGSSSTLAAKFPAEDEKSRATASMLGLYAKEVQFYQHIAPSLSARMPRTHHAQMDETGTQYILLFEDLGPARIGNQLDGCTIEDAREAIKQAAAVHGGTWEKNEIIDADWLRTPEPVVQQINALYPQAQSTFRERYADTLEPEFMQLCQALAGLPDLGAARLSPPQCVVHGDFRLDNLLFDVKGGAEAIAVLDWQTVVAGRAMTDIGYFMGTGIGDTLRGAHEDELLDLYCREMDAHGVNLTRNDIWREYRIGALHGLFTAVFSAAFVERTERGDANFLSMARGACALALEHDSLGAVLEGA